MSELKEYQPTSPEIDQTIKKIYDNTIVKYKEKFDKKKKTLEQYEEFSDFVITTSDSGVSNYLRSYALDCTSAPYELPDSKLNKLRKHYFKVLISSDKDYAVMNELFYHLFTWTYSPAIKNAIENKAKVLAERDKMNGEKRAEGNRVPIAD